MYEFGFLGGLAQTFGDPVCSYGHAVDPLCSEGQGGLSALSGLLVCEHLEVSTLKVELSSFDAKLCFRISST